MADPIEAVVPVLEPVVVPDKNGETVPKSQHDAVVQELKELRSKKSNDGGSVVDIDKKIAEALQAREREEADKNWVKAQQTFLSKHKEYMPDNDTGGLKKAILDRELRLLNRGGITSPEDLEVVLEKAHTLATVSTNSSAHSVRIDPSIPRSIPEVRSNDGSKLDDKELRMLDSLDALGASTWTEERLLKLKERDPEFYARTLARTN